MSFVIFSNLVMSVAWKVVTDGYFKVHSYLSLFSDFWLYSNFLMAISISIKYKTTSKLHAIETATPPLVLLHHYDTSTLVVYVTLKAVNLMVLLI